LFNSPGDLTHAHIHRISDPNQDGIEYDTDEANDAYRLGFETTVDRWAMVGDNCSFRYVTNYGNFTNWSGYGSDPLATFGINSFIYTAGDNWDFREYDSSDNDYNTISNINFSEDNDNFPYDMVRNNSGVWVVVGGNRRMDHNDVVSWDDTTYPTVQSNARGVIVRSTNNFNTTTLINSGILFADILFFIDVSWDGSSFIAPFKPKSSGIYAGTGGIAISPDGTSWTVQYEGEEMLYAKSNGTIIVAHDGEWLKYITK